MATSNSQVSSSDFVNPPFFAFPPCGWMCSIRGFLPSTPLEPFLLDNNANNTFCIGEEVVQVCSLQLRDWLSCFLGCWKILHITMLFDGMNLVIVLLFLTYPSPYLPSIYISTQLLMRIRIMSLQRVYYRDISNIPISLVLYGSWISINSPLI